MEPPVMSPSTRGERWDTLRVMELHEVLPPRLQALLVDPRLLRSSVKATRARKQDLYQLNMIKGIFDVCECACHFRDALGDIACSGTVSAYLRQFDVCVDIVFPNTFAAF